MDQLENRVTGRVTRRDGWTELRRAGFLECLSAIADVKHACAFVGMSRQSAYRLRARDPGFAAAWDAALRAAHEAAVRAFLAELPESLLRTLSRLSAMCHLQPSGRAIGMAPESVPGTLSQVSAPCHLQPSGQAIGAGPLPGTVSQSSAPCHLRG